MDFFFPKFVVGARVQVAFVVVIVIWLKFEGLIPNFGPRTTSNKKSSFQSRLAYVLNRFYQGAGLKKSWHKSKHVHKYRTILKTNVTLALDFQYRDSNSYFSQTCLSSFDLLAVFAKYGIPGTSNKKAFW